MNITKDDIECLKATIRLLEKEGYNKETIEPKKRLVKKLQTLSLPNKSNEEIVDMFRKDWEDSSFAPEGGTEQIVDDLCTWLRSHLPNKVKPVVLPERKKHNDTCLYVLDEISCDCGNGIVEVNQFRDEVIELNKEG